MTRHVLKTYIVDSDIVIDGLRKIPGAADYFDSLGDWYYSAATAMECFAGSKREILDIEETLEPYRRIALSAEIGESSLDLLRRYAKSDEMRAIDALAAAAAIAEGLTLSTRNRKHFRNVKGLEIEVPGY